MARLRALSAGAGARRPAVPMVHPAVSENCDPRRVARPDKRLVECASTRADVNRAVLRSGEFPAVPVIVGGSLWGDRDLARDPWLGELCRRRIGGPASGAELGLADR